MSDYKIYVASLSDYNSGVLHGSWIDLEGQTKESLNEAIQEMLKASPTAKEYGDEAEEWAIHDYELEGLNISEYESLDNIVKLTEALEEHGEAIAVYYNDRGENDVESIIEDFEDAYCGEYDCFEDYAEELFEECYAHEIPSSMRHYIDTDRFARDLLIDGYHFEKGHVFRAV